MTDAELLERGLKAASLLSNPDLLDFIESEKALILEAIGNTNPQETKTRESLYYQHHAISQFLIGLNQYVEKANALVVELEADANTEDTEDTD